MLATLLCFDSGFASSVITGGLAPMRVEFGVSTDVSFRVPHYPILVLIT